MDFYFQDHLRWNLGFDNPNKAAALMASLLPLLWILYALAWNIPERVWRLTAIFASALTLLAGWGLLIMTYSRGGIVAAIAATVYILWKLRRERNWKNVRTLVSGGLLVLICGLALSTGAAHRSTQWIGQREGSVENRLELWQGSLQMIASVPQGVGTGNSGRFYMQWFQPLDGTSRYRTLVNSYLTFASEQGLALFGVAIFGATYFWCLTLSAVVGPIIRICMTGLRASWMAFAVAGIFTTTMEEPLLWVVPAIAAAGLVVLKFLFSEESRWIKMGIVAATSAVVMPAALMCTGWWLERNTPLKISFQHKPSERVTITPRSGAVNSMQALVDEDVLGADYGKLIRQFAADKNVEIHTLQRLDNRLSGNLIMAGGIAITDLSQIKGYDCLLIAPPIIEDSKADVILNNAKSVKLFLPDFDEDGRVAFWREKADISSKNIDVIVLPGVGNKIAWAWNIVIEEGFADR